MKKKDLVKGSVGRPKKDVVVKRGVGRPKKVVSVDPVKLDLVLAKSLKFQDRDIPERVYSLRLALVICSSILGVFCLIGLAWGRVPLMYAFILVGSLLACFFIAYIMNNYQGD